MDSDDSKIDNIFFTLEFGQNPDLNTRWNSYIRKLRYPEPLVFAAVVEAISAWLRPYVEEVALH